VDERLDQVDRGDPALAWLNQTALLRGLVVVGDAPGGVAREMWSKPLVVELVGPGWRGGDATADGPVFVGVDPEHIVAVAQLIEKLRMSVPAALGSEEGRRRVALRVRVHGRGLRGGIGEGVDARRWRVSPCDAGGAYYEGRPGKSHLDFSVEVPEAWLVERDVKGVGAARIAIEAGRVLMRDGEGEPVGPAAEREAEDRPQMNADERGSEKGGG